MKCNCCGSSKWSDMNNRKNVRCSECGSLERTRILKLLLDSYNLPQKRMNILHLAPEKGLYEFFVRQNDIEYNPVDLFPENFKFGTLTKFDCCTEAEKLPSNIYDIIIHSHVMEHIPCNVSSVLINLHRALKPDGFHFMCVPFMGGYSSEDFSDLADEERSKRFGQLDYMRKFGKKDIQKTIGMVFNIPKFYDLDQQFDSDILDEINIPFSERKGYSGSSVFVLRKSDLKLKF